MKISIDRGILLKALNHVQSVVERRNTIPILSNVKIDANEKNISLIATDLDLEIINSVLIYSEFSEMSFYFNEIGIIYFLINNHLLI